MPDSWWSWGQVVVYFPPDWVPFFILFFTFATCRLSEISCKERRRRRRRGRRRGWQSMIHVQTDCPFRKGILRHARRAAGETRKNMHSQLLSFKSDRLMFFRLRDAEKEGKSRESQQLVKKKGRLLANCRQVWRSCHSSWRTWFLALNQV